MDSGKSSSTPHRVAVIGAGTIGASWAALFLAHGCHVRIYDPSNNVRDTVYRQIETAWPSLVTLAKTTETIPDHLSFHDAPEDAVAGTHFVQESVPETLELKHEIFRRMEPVLGADTVVASSASGLLVKDMQRGWKDPRNFLLGHPFNPPHLIPLVELIGNERTSEDALAAAEHFYRACGKVTIRIKKEVPGHVANRLQAALWREAINLVVNGVASVADVDKAVSAGPGLRWSVMGPHMLFALGSGGGGMGEFCKRYAASFHVWWSTLGEAELTPDAIDSLVTGLAEAEAGRSYTELSALRDRRLVAAMKALDVADSDK